MRIPWLSILLVGMAPLAGAAPPASNRGPLDPLLYRDLAEGMIARSWTSLRRLEIVEMISAVMAGSNVGPGDGWFHPSQSRYSWNWLADRFDRNRDGRITLEEFNAPAELFARLDRDRDGIVQRNDFDWSDSSPYVRQLGMARGWMSRLDGDSNGQLTREEWLKFFEKASRGKGYLTPEDIRDALMVAPPRPAGPSPGGPNIKVLLAGLYTGELGSFFEGPAVGKHAPGFTLRTHDGKRTVRLKDVTGRKPVVLIFGSFT